MNGQPAGISVLKRTVANALSGLYRRASVKRVGLKSSQIRIRLGLLSGKPVSQ